MKQPRLAAALLPLLLLPYGSAQQQRATVTIGIRSCSTNTMPTSSFLPGYSLASTTYGSMSEPSSQSQESTGLVTSTPAPESFTACSTPGWWSTPFTSATFAFQAADPSSEAFSSSAIGFSSSETPSSLATSQVTVGTFLSTSPTSTAVSFSSSSSSPNAVFSSSETVSSSISTTTLSTQSSPATKPSPTSSLSSSVTSAITNLPASSSPTESSSIATSSGNSSPVYSSLISTTTPPMTTTASLSRSGPTSSSPSTSSPPSVSSSTSQHSLPTSLTPPAPSTSSSSSSTSSVPAGPTYVTNNGKRGLTYTNATLTLPYSQAGQDSLVNWGYNWYYSRYTDTINTTNPAIRFIPLLYSDDPTLLAAWPAAAQQAIDAGADALMSFNEPDLCAANSGAACMTINASVKAYKSAMMPFAGRIPIGAPAVTDNGGIEWLQDFMGNCTDCRFDFIALHWYNNAYAFGYLQYYLQRAYALFQKPIWLTEFGMSYNGGSEEQVQAFLMQALPWLDAVPYVQRYAWFFDGPGDLINANGSGLSARGVIYNNYTAPCPNWNNTDGHC